MAEEVKKEELPPIVMISEAQFIEKQLEPAYDAIKGDAKEPAATDEVQTMDRATVKKLMVEAIGRGEITDEIYNHWFDQMPKPKGKEDAEPITIYNAKECVVRFAISIKMVPTRLKTALENFVDARTQPERQIYDFFKNESLTDVTLIHPTTGALYRTHRIIIASGSSYMLEVFTKHSVEKLPKVKVPEPFN